MGVEGRRAKEKCKVRHGGISEKTVIFPVIPEHGLGNAAETGRETWRFKGRGGSPCFLHGS